MVSSRISHIKKRAHIIDKIDVLAGFAAIVSDNYDRPAFSDRIGHRNIICHPRNIVDDNRACGGILRRDLGFVSIDRQRRESRLEQVVRDRLRACEFVCFGRWPGARASARSA